MGYKLTKVVSGGQTGADQGGLHAAKKLGIATGGFIPQGCLTEKGPNVSLKEDFGLEETESSQYPPRTFANARASDGTMRFACDFTTRGEHLTLLAVKRNKKPHFDVDILSPPPVEEAADWIVHNGIKVLNVAGNRESTHPGMHRVTQDYLTAVIMMLDKM